MNLKQLLFGAQPGQTNDPQYSKSSQSWLPVADIQKGMVLTKDGRYVKILEILPVNFRLKSAMERQNMIYYFSSYLKVAPRNLQILCITAPADMESYTSRMRALAEKETSAGCRMMIEDNIAETNYLASSEAITHRFFLVFQLEPQMRCRASTLEGIGERLLEEEQTARRYLDMCGLEVVRPDYSDNFLLGLLYQLVNPRTSKHMPLPLQVFDAVSKVYGADDNDWEARINEQAAVENVGARAAGQLGLEGETGENAATGKKAKKTAKKKRMKKRGRREKEPELSPLQSGAYTVPDIIAPSTVAITARDHIIVDGVYHATLYVTGYGYPTYVDSGWLTVLVEAGEGVAISFSLRKQPKEKILPKVAKTTMINRSRMRDVDDTRQDFEEMDSAIHSGLFMKNEMNRNGEDFYFMSTLAEISAESPDELEHRIAKFETLCTSQGFQVRRADYRHEAGFLSTLPLNQLDPDLERKSRRNILTRDAAAAFPFSSYEICDSTGIVLGINQHNRSLCMLDIFDSSKYEAANMSIVGMTGGGKTMLLQLIGLRLREQHVRVLVIVPEKGYEYRPACEAIGGQYIKLAPGSRDCINWLAIRKRSRDANAYAKNLEERGDSLLAEKIESLHLFFSLRIPDMTPNDREILDHALVDCYARFGIGFDNASLFQEDGASRPQPDFGDLHRLFLEKPETQKFAVAISRYVTGSAANMGGQTNVDLDNFYTVIDISEAGKSMITELMLLCFTLAKDICYEDITQKKAIIIDELWRLIGTASNSDVAEFILEFWKVIRGLGGAAIGASQDMSADYHALEDGKYGKAILNASRFKIVLPLEEEEAKFVQETLHLSDEETLQILRNRRGEGLFCAGHNRISVSFRASQKEYEWITTQRKDLEAQLAHRK